MNDLLGAKEPGEDEAMEDLPKPKRGGPSAPRELSPAVSEATASGAGEQNESE